MLKAVKSNKVVPTIETTKIRLSYNGEKCYKCNKNDRLLPVTNDGGSISYCGNCGIQVILWEYIPEDVYKNKIDENLISSRMYNPSAIKRESFNNFITKSI